MSFARPSLLIASHNVGKSREIGSLLSGAQLELCNAIELGMPEVVETGESFRENAQLKSETAAQWSALPSLADDSGMCVIALNGFPGIKTKRFALNRGGWTNGMAELNRRLAQQTNHRATYHCALSLSCLVEGGEIVYGHHSDAQLRTIVVEAIIPGSIVWPARGTGYAFDAIFKPDGSEQTYGEMSDLVRESCNHRFRAFQLLLQALNALPETDALRAWAPLLQARLESDLT